MKILKTALLIVGLFTVCAVSINAVQQEDGGSASNNQVSENKIDKSVAENYRIVPLPTMSFLDNLKQKLMAN